MNKLGDIELFVSIVQSSGLAAGAKKLGLSPATATSRMNNLESSYGVRLLTRTTRKTSLTEEGRIFYTHCLRILEEVRLAEENVTNKNGVLTGPIKMTATVDLGKSVIAPLVADFVKANPNVNIELILVDHMVNLVGEGYDLGIRYGRMPDSRMIARKLAKSSRLLLASPKYVDKHGEPTSPEDLVNHRCITLARADQSLNDWFFCRNDKEVAISIKPTLASNDGSQVRDWAIAGNGITIKSYWDVKDDIDSNRLVPLLSDYAANYWPDAHKDSADLYAVYPSKKYLPERIRALLDVLIKRFTVD
jgi:DNA-binding transcriptional LysR family regulator